MAYDNTNSGAIFKNDRKESDKHPDYKGSLNVEGREYWVSSWINRDKNGNAYMSVKVNPKDDRPVNPNIVESEKFEEDVPF
jgi:uncharacterized protein (DUF736 family)